MKNREGIFIEKDERERWNRQVSTNREALENEKSEFKVIALELLIHCCMYTQINDEGKIVE